MRSPIRTLLFSTLYPSSVRPIHGIFVETRLRELLKTGLVQSKVVAPVPWFPFKAKRFGKYAQFAATPRYERLNGVEIFHPRYFLPPKVGMNLAPHSLAMSALPVVRKIIANGFQIDLIDAHYYYPDGVAAAIIARALRKPLVITARGTDLNLIPEYSRPRRLILQAANQAAGSIGVSNALMARLAELGADSAKLHVMRNGVDLDRFEPVDRQEARQHLQIADGFPLLLSVGHLVELKGHHIAIEAMPLLPPKARLLIVGTGPESGALEASAKALGIADRVQFIGQVPQTELKWWYSAADALVLCSSREGWANVLLEAMACGTPVIATNIHGTPEVVSSSDAGVLMSSRSAEGLLQGWAKLQANLPTRAATRRYAETFSWGATTQGQLDLFGSLV